MDNLTKSVVVVGGGTSGWISAGLLAANLKKNDKNIIDVTVVESPNHSIIGVGEGTWPTMRKTLQSIGLSESELIKSCSASFKQGTQFNYWLNESKKQEYYHPFTLPAGQHLNIVDFYSQVDDKNFCESVSCNPLICKKFLAPKLPDTPEYKGIENYAYHFDASKFSKVLKKHCLENLGVKLIQSEVVDAELDSKGFIVKLNLLEGISLEGDFFVDCTGFNSILKQKYYPDDFISSDKFLFSNSALTVQLPYNNCNSPINSNTLSTACQYGWIWDIGLSDRRGIGHVYSDDFCSENDAYDSLLSYVNRIDDSIVEKNLIFKKLKFKSGYYKSFWKKNCVSVGLSAGFVEPLEASAIVMIELSAKFLVDFFPENRDLMKPVSKKFNENFSYHWKKIIDFIKLHYCLSERNDSNFWLENRRPETIPDSLKDLLEISKAKGLSVKDFCRTDEIFPLASYQYVMAGMNFNFPKNTDVNQTACAKKIFLENEYRTAKLLAALPTNRNFLNNFLVN